MLEPICLIRPRGHARVVAEAAVIGIGGNFMENLSELLNTIAGAAWVLGS